MMYIKYYFLNINYYFLTCSCMVITHYSSLGSILITAKWDENFECLILTSARWTNQRVRSPTPAAVVAFSTHRDC